MFLRQSTVQGISLGPFLDITDLSEKTALTLAATDVQIAKYGAGFGNKADATAPVHDQNAWYNVQLGVTDTATPGGLTVKVDNAATHLPVKERYLVLPQPVFDSLVLGTDALQVDLAQWLGAAPLALAAGRVQTMVAAMGAGVLDSTALDVTAANEIRDAVRNMVVESAGGFTLQQVLSLLLAFAGGLTTALGAQIKTPDGSATRIAATINASNERTSMALTPSA
jgi:hypothetical protein